MTNVELLNWIHPSLTSKANSHKLRKVVQVESVSGKEYWNKSFVDCTLQLIAISEVNCLKFKNIFRVDASYTGILHERTFNLLWKCCYVCNGIVHVLLLS